MSRAADQLAASVTPAHLEAVREAKRALKDVGGRCRRLAAALHGILEDDDDMLVGGGRTGGWELGMPVG